MKVIIAGSREYGYLSLEHINNAVILSGYTVDRLVCGMAKKGIDNLAVLWAHKEEIPIDEFWPNWSKFGKAGGIHRNCEMGDYADAGIVIWDEYSPGSSHMAQYLLDIGKPHILLTLRNGMYHVIRQVD